MAASFSQDLTTLIWLRFVTGIGLGGAMPTSLTLAAEYSPTPRRASLVTMMFCGFTIGSALGGVIAAHVLERFGWRPLLAAGGIIPLALAPVLWWALPESVRYLLAIGSAPSRIAAVLAGIAPGVELRGATFAGETAVQMSPVRQVFSGGLMRGTLLLWLAFFIRAAALSFSVAAADAETGARGASAHAKMSRATFRRLASPVRKRLEGPPRRSIDNRRDLIVPMPEPFREPDRAMPRTSGRSTVS